MNPQGIYTLVSYGKTLQKNMEGISNNLANIQSSGYKGDQPAFQSLFAKSYGVPSQSDEEVFAHHEHLAPYTGVGTLYVSIAAMGTNYDQGDFRQTGNPYDVAIMDQNAFFSIDTARGERYTRAGNFMRSTDGQLITSNGYPVIGQNGPIMIQGENFGVGEDGSVSVDNQIVDRLKIVSFPDPYKLMKTGGSLFASPLAGNEPQIVEGARLLQSTLEGSNVNTFSEMVRMIDANRSYSSMRRILTSADLANEQAISLGNV